MYGFVIVIAAFIISLLVFPKYRPHIIGGTVVIGLLLYFTTDKDIRDGRRADTDIRLKEISVQNALLEWNGTDSRFSGRLRNNSRQDLAALEMRFVITSCTITPAEQTSGNGTETVSAEKRTLIHGVFYDALHAKDADITAESQRWAQRRHLGNTATDCKIIDTSDTSFTLPKPLPRGREKDTVIPVSFAVPLPDNTDISWYWGFTAARKAAGITESNTTTEPAEPVKPETPQE